MANTMIVQNMVEEKHFHVPNFFDFAFMDYLLTFKCSLIRFFDSVQ